MDFNFHDESLRVIPVWIIIFDLLVKCWGPNSLSMCSILEEPICTNDVTASQSRIAFARVLVEVDVTKEVPKKNKG